MKIRTALTLKYTCVTATIFLLCTVLIYLVSEHTRDHTFFRNLKSEGITKANLFLAGQVDARTMQSVYLNNRKFINEVEVAVYTTDFQMLYHDAIHNDIVKETQGMINAILKKKEIEFHIGKYQGIGMVYIIYSYCRCLRWLWLQQSCGVTRGLDYNVYSRFALDLCCWIFLGTNVTEAYP